MSKTLYDKQRRDERRANGLCVVCGDQTEGTAQCRPCTDRRRQSRHDSRRKRKEAGVCDDCGETRLPDHKLCRDCYLKVIAGLNTGSRANWEHILQLFYDQNQRCAMSGRKLILGKNAQLDHILPRSRFPELKHDLENLQWLHEDVNLAKRNMTPDEFVNLCEEVSKHRWQLST